MATVKLTETQLRNIIAESVKQILNEQSFRIVVGPNEFFDFLNGIQAGQWITLGYVTPAKVNVPKGYRINPETHRKNQFDDWDAFGKQYNLENVTGVIKLSTYHFQWQDSEEVGKKYDTWKSDRDRLRQQYGLETRKATYSTKKVDYGKGISGYDGDNEKLAGHTYSNFNMFNIIPKTSAYYIISNGELVEVDKSELDLLPPSIDKTIQNLLSAGASQSEVDCLSTFSYRRFEHSRILFLCATSDKEPKLFINTSLSDTISKGLHVEPNALIQIAKDTYQNVYDLI